MPTETLTNGAIIDDKRTDRDRHDTEGFVLAIDTFLSGWGKAPNRSYFAVPFKDGEQGAIVKANMCKRSDMKCVRIVGKNYFLSAKPKKGDHISIRSMSDSDRFYKKGGW